MGGGRLIEHLNPEAVAGRGYGELKVFMRRPRDANLAPINAASNASRTVSEHRSVSENTAAGTAIGKPVTTEDPEGYTLTYSLIGADAGHFAIDAASGQLRTKGALDYESKHTYEVVVTATDGRLLGSIPVTINVTDLPELRVTMPVVENTAAGRAIGVPMTPPGVDSSSGLTYALGGPDAGHFAMDASGQLLVKGALDYETKVQYEITITATDRGQRSVVIVTTIQVTDMADTPPGKPAAPTFTQVEQTQFRVTWQAPAQQGSGIMGYHIQYKESSAADSGYAYVSPTNRGIGTSYNVVNRFVQSVTRGTSYDVRVRATILLGGHWKNGVLGGPWSDVGTVTTAGEPLGKPAAPTFTQVEQTQFRVKWRAPHLPIPMKPAYWYSPSRRAALVPLLQGSAIIGYGIQYKASSAPDSAYADVSPMPSGTGLGYHLVNNSGESITAGTSYDVRVRIKRGRRWEWEWDRPGTYWGPWSDAGTVTTTGRPPPGKPAAPTFTQVQQTRFRVTWQAPAQQGSGIAGYDIQYKASSAADSAYAYVNPIPWGIGTGYNVVNQTGQSVTAGTSYDVRVRAWTVYMMCGPWSEAGTVTTAAAVNEAPAFANSSVSRSVAENTVAGTNIGDAVAATDSDTGDTLTYTLGDTADDGHFDIDADSGQLKTSGALDYESTSSYSVTVTATDGGGLTASIDVTISVTNVNEAPAYANASASLSVAENTAADAAIGNPVVAADPDDGDTLTYALGTTADDGHFAIDSATGQLQTQGALDYEGQRSYTVTVTATDGGGLTASIVVTITVADVDEVLRPGNVQAALQSDGSMLITWEAPAGPGDLSFYRVRRRVDAADSSYQVITRRVEDADNDGAAEYLDQGGDLEAGQSYLYSVRAFDGNGDNIGKWTEGVLVSIPAAAPAENEAPAFANSSVSRSVAENTVAGTNIGDAVAATDSDTGDTLTYTLGDTADDGHFDIDADSGQLKTSGALDYESTSSYSVTVTATDGGGLTASIAVTISVTNVNEAPAYANASATLEVAENTAADAAIGNPVVAADPDDGDTLTYALGTTADDGHFAIDSSTGQLSTQGALDYETDDSYTITVTATDGGGLTASIAVTITVADVDEGQQPVNVRVNLRSDGISVRVVWDAPAGAGEDTFYRVRRSLDVPDGKANVIARRVTDADGVIKYRDESGDLEAGQSYLYSVRAFDGNGDNIGKWTEGVLNQGQGGMCIRLRRGIGLGIWQECFGP